ncbi:hypothetical protein PLEOSDRAFT_154623 [Pleurotus ostreatus PC15]|uniref:Uncharacterized protein n=1 Tax=Pleurotus ostreatus (strain PC15) TaxID=1137138 RepID=A0A067NZK4_PLEO1|nr:hypothetical protein PLEOSDRAFT_1100874 [Pleurotus ostreatus PC15]KDQ32410.1 hypothetical protein PLEOSDRAFT_154623 [Pleurotus ostreatus PC15]
MALKDQFSADSPQHQLPLSTLLPAMHHPLASRFTRQEAPASDTTSRNVYDAGSTFLHLNTLRRNCEPKRQRTGTTQYHQRHTHLGIAWYCLSLPTARQKPINVSRAHNTANMAYDDDDEAR